MELAHNFSPADARVLIVDDTPKNIQVLGTILKQAGYQINVAQGGLQALKVVERVTPDLILLDIMMPDIDGFETCRRMKEIPDLQNVPVIFLTAKSDSESVIAGFEMGAVDYVVKPFNTTELLMRVRTQLELRFAQMAVLNVSHARKELLHILCHDLANPLNSIVSLVNMIGDYFSFEEARDLLMGAAQNGLDVIKLVREMRALEEHKLSLGAISVSHAIEESIKLLQQNFAKKHISLEKYFCPEDKVLAERTSLVNSVLNNLLTNAIKFSYPHSAIRIRTHVQAGNTLCVEIEDVGIGMSWRLQQDLFDIGKTTSREGTAGEHGTGFGMPLVNKFMQAYGGSIEIDSRDQKQYPESHGTTVRLIFQRVLVDAV